MSDDTMIQIAPLWQICKSRRPSYDLRKTTGFISGQSVQPSFGAWSCSSNTARVANCKDSRAQSR